MKVHSVLILVLAGILIYPSSSHSQDPPTFGFYAGISTLRFEKNVQDNEYTFRPSFIIGVGWDINVLGADFPLKLLALYQERGASVKAWSFDDSPDQYYTVSYPQVVLQPQIHYRIQWSDMSIAPYLGMQIGFNKSLAIAILTLPADDDDLPFVEYTLTGGISFSSKKVLDNSLGLACAYIYSPEEISYIFSPRKKLHWQGFQFLLSYRY